MEASQEEFNFETARLDFKLKVSKDLLDNKSDSVPVFTELYGKYIGTETEKKTATDQTLRDLIREELNSIKTANSSNVVTNILDIVTISVSIAKQGFCSPSIPFIILGDVLDCITLDACDIVFHYIEERVGIWKSTIFYTAGKNYLLRMCNDLLRRLSQSKNTVFCGRIQLFLARLFPLSEKSALNLVSQFNLENVTVFNKDPDNSALKQSTEDESDEKMEVEASAEPLTLEDTISKENDLVDFKLYQSIWNLQDMFRYPVQCYTKELWDKFTNNAASLFRIFSSYKLEDTAHSRSTTASSSSRVYFPKFLTSEKLTSLQLNDSLFRRQILTQFLILFRYLTANIKFKGTSLVLTDAMKSWIAETEPQIYDLLKETPPKGKRFVQYIKHLMEREEYWITWKNEGCPSFMKNPKPSDDDDKPVSKKRKVDKSPTTIVEEFASGKNLGMGSAELTRLWNLSSDNLAACQAPSREFIPSLQDYFIECVEQNDPKNQIEDQYKSVYNSNFQWKALRLLSHRSQLFFTSQPTSMQFKTVPDYLSTIVGKLAKDFPAQPSENGVTMEGDGQVDEPKNVNGTDESKDEDVLGQENGDEDDGDIGDDDDDVLDDSQNEESSESGATNSNQLSSDDVTNFASKIGSEWKKVALQLNLKAKDIKEIEEDSDDPVLQARQSLVTWQDMVGKEATMTSLNEALKSAGLHNLVDK